MDADDCLNIKVGEHGKVEDRKVCGDDVLKKLYEESAPKVTQVNGTKESGTGFFVGNGDQVITNAHVASSKGLSISTYDGNVYPAYVEKYDDIHDLSLLRIVGIEKDPDRAIKLAPDDRISGTVYSLGHPQLESLTISPGQMIGNGSQYEAMVQSKGKERSEQMIENAAKRIGEKQTQDLRDQLNSTEIWLRQYDTPGSSGSPQLNENGELIAVLHTGYNDAKNRMTGNIPLSAVRDLLSPEPGRFEFKYEWKEFKIMNESGKHLATSLEIKSIKRNNVAAEDAGRPPFFFDLFPEYNGKI